MNIIICPNQKTLLLIKPYINLKKFVVLSSVLNLKILLPNNHIKLVLYADSVKADLNPYMNKIQKSISFKEVIQQLNKNNTKLITKKNPNIKKNIKNNTVNTTNTTKNICSNKTKDTIINKDIKKPVILKTIQKNKINTTLCHNNIKKTNILENKQRQYKKNVIPQKLFKRTHNSSFSTLHKNNIYLFTSVKGGVGVSSLIVELSKLKIQKIILDLSFVDGGSDLSYYFNLPVVPHIGTYLNEYNEYDVDNALNTNLLSINNFTQILQAPSSKNIYNNITNNDIKNLLSQKLGNILIDIPFYSQYLSELLNLTTKVFIITTGLPMEINRINTMFKAYKDIITCIIINPREKKYASYLSECDLKFITYKNFLEKFMK